MAKFCVAYINFFDNDLQQKIVEADSMFDAVVTAEFAQSEETGNWSDYESMQQYFFYGDSAISVIELQ